MVHVSLPEFADLLRSRGTALGGGAGQDGGPACTLVETPTLDELDSSLRVDLGALAGSAVVSRSGSETVALLSGILGRVALVSCSGSSRGRMRGSIGS